MEENKARIIIYSAHESYKKLMYIASSIMTQDNDVELELFIKQNILRVAGKISYEILYPLYKKYPEIKSEIDVLNEGLSLSLVKKDTLKNKNVLMGEYKARVIAFVATGAFYKLGGSLVPYIVSISEQNDSNKDKLELEVTQAIVEQSGDIILKILKPIFKVYPVIKEEIDTVYQEFGLFPC